MARPADYMALNASRIDPSTRQRLREYLHRSRHLQLSRTNNDIMRILSPALQGEVAFKINERWLARVPFLANTDTGFLVQLALALEPMVFAPGELPEGVRTMQHARSNANPHVHLTPVLVRTADCVFRGCISCPFCRRASQTRAQGKMYIIHRGIALYGARMLNAGKVWGDDVMLRDPTLQRPYKCIAMNYLEVFTLTYYRMRDVAESYPRTKALLQSRLRIMALRRTIVLMAKFELGLPPEALLSARHATVEKRTRKGAGGEAIERKGSFCGKLGGGLFVASTMAAQSQRRTSTEDPPSCSKEESTFAPRAAFMGAFFAPRLSGGTVVAASDVPDVAETPPYPAEDMTEVRMAATPSHVRPPIPSWEDSEDAATEVLPVLPNDVPLTPQELARLRSGK